MVHKNRDLVNIVFAIIVLMFICLWIPLEIAAQTQPEPTPECVTVDGEEFCISAIAMTPFAPTVTPIPPPTATIEIRPFVRPVVYLSLIFH